MTLRDLPGVMVVNQQCFSNPWSDLSIKYDLQSNPNSYWLVLEYVSQKQSRLKRVLNLLGRQSLDRHIIGFGAFWIMNGEAHITNIGVDPQFQGYGWGEVLLISILQRSIQLNARFSTLEVRVSNQRAINLYKKYAYRIVGHKQAYYHDNQEDAHDMSTEYLDRSYQRMLEQRVAELTLRVQWRDYFVGRIHYETRRTTASPR
jgi:ribosomal-protein-alanine N-acetyltransferase